MLQLPNPVSNGLNVKMVANGDQIILEPCYEKSVASGDTIVLNSLYQTFILQLNTTSNEKSCAIGATIVLKPLY